MSFGITKTVPAKAGDDFVESLYDGRLDEFEFHMAGRERPMLLEPRDPVLYFVQRLRDEAHRFAIGTHRAKRAKVLADDQSRRAPGRAAG